ncbi:MAG: restriction endonuclease subunit S [Acidobacteriota bacterium]
MTNDWESVALESLIEPGRGISYGIVQPGSPVSGGVPIVRVGDVRNGRIATSDPLRVAPAIEASYSRTRLSGGELLLTLVGTVGETAVVPESLKGWNTARAVAVIPVRKDVGAYWVQMALRAPGVRAIIDSRLNTTVQATLNLGDVAQLPIVLPPLREREAIAHILGTLDDKIELNRRMNETLEAMARTLFKSWFVDFDPVRAKAEGRDPCLPKPLADLFPDSFEDSELGEIPNGWEVGTLADVAALNPESWSKVTRPATINYVDLSNTKWGRIESVTTHTRQDAPSRAQRVLRSGDTVVGTVRPGNGSYAFVTEERLTGSTGFAVLRPQRHEYREYVYIAATTAENIEELAHLADGAAYPAVRPEVVAATVSIQPPDFVLTSFAKTAGPLLARIAASDRESRTLAALRDTLLPKLISGELRIKPRGRNP